MAAAKTASLEARYGSSIDSALLIAILSDFDLSKPDDVYQAEKILDGIERSAAEENDSGFDPSGTSSTYLGARPKSDGSNLNVPSSSKETSVLSTDSDPLDWDRGFGSFNVDGNMDDRNSGWQSLTGNDLDYIGQLDNEEKKTILLEMFSSLPDTRVTHSFEKFQGDMAVIIEDLLTKTYFTNPPDGEEKVLDRSIDAFSEDQMWKNTRPKRKSKRKMHKIQDYDTPYSNHVPTAPQPRTLNSWNALQEDVQFITSRTGLSTEKVKSAYHRNGFSLASTIIELLEVSDTDDALIAPESDVIETNAHDLLKDFPTINLSHCLALIRVTYPSTSNAHELAKAIVSSPSKINETQSSGAVTIIPTYAPRNMSHPENDWTVVKTTSELEQSSQLGTRPLNSRALAALYNVAYNTARSQERDLRSRSRSSGNTLWSQGAGYYAERSREFALKRDAAESQNADVLVAHQSTHMKKLDLHGVSVKDAVRIARDKTEEWWNSGGRSVLGLDGRRGEGHGGEGFVIVVGKGLHSQGGKWKLGPAVKKMLLTEGWKMDEREGEFIVTGKKR